MWAVGWSLLGEGEHVTENRVHWPREGAEGLELDVSRGKVDTVGKESGGPLEKSLSFQGAAAASLSHWEVPGVLS